MVSDAANSWFHTNDLNNKINETVCISEIFDGCMSIDNNQKLLVYALISH